MRTWPAVEIPRVVDAELAVAAADDFGPTAVEEHGSTIRIFFFKPSDRDAAWGALTAAGYSAEPRDVDDEDWARRSQQDLRPVTVGCVTIAPPWAAPLESSLTSHRSPVDGLPSTVTVVVSPSMGFGTGHHATTRLCLAALQAVDLTGRTVLDVGTGSGVLAIAAARLGAGHVVGLDNDPDAIQSATENLVLNPEARRVEFRIADLIDAALPPADIVIANLIGALIARTSQILLTAVQPGGTVIGSGILSDERDEVRRALGPPVEVVWEEQEAGWVAMALKKR